MTELLVVVVIISVILALATISLFSHRVKAYDAEAELAARSIGLAIAAAWIGQRGPDTLPTSGPIHEEIKRATQDKSIAYVYEVVGNDWRFCTVSEHYEQATVFYFDQESFEVIAMASPQYEIVGGRLDPRDCLRPTMK